MLSLRKIKELKGYRFFQSYRWDENNCRLFERNNIVYGWNGSGKTTLCDFFKDLEAKSLSVDGSSCSLLFHDSASDQMKSVTHTSLTSVPFAFKVFHQEYIQENIKQDTVKHIFTVGKEQAEKLAEIKNLRTQAKKQEALVTQLYGECNILMQNFERFKTSKAKTIKDSARYSNSYNKNSYEASHRVLLEKTILTDEEYQNAMTAIRSQPLSELMFSVPAFVRQPDIACICDILNQTPVNKTIDALKNNASVSEWVEQGLTLHDEQPTTVCLFCGNVISYDRYEELRCHFNKSYRELSDKIDSTITYLIEKYRQFETVKHDLPNAGLLYQEFQQKYQQYISTAIELCDQYMNVIINIIDVLKLKKADMINELLTAEFIVLTQQLSFDYGIFEKINNIIIQHNEKTKGFHESIRQAQKTVELHLVSVYSDEFSDLESQITDKKEEFEEQKKTLIGLRQQIDILEQDVRNSQIPADKINKDIAFIMGRSELIFTNTEMGYLITRNGERAKNLSKGEENAIALIYFFNALQDVDVNPSDTIVVLDDPISSFDSNFYYNAISYIREKTLHVGQTFIFTHKFALLKDFSMMFKENTNRYTIQRIMNAPQIKDEDNLIGQYHDEYAYLFKKIYDFVKFPPSDTSEYLQYPNIARRVLEGFLTFKLPSSSSLIDKVLELEQCESTVAGRAVMRLLNNHSHLRVISSSDIADDIDSIATLPDILYQLMEFIKRHDKRHYDTLALLSDSQYNSNGDAVNVIRIPVREVKFFTMAASAGLGDFLDDNPDAQTIQVANQECTFAVKISGNSMEPEVHDGDVVLVKSCEEIPNAHMGIVWYQGNCYCKKVVKSDEKLLLVSENKTYRPIPIESFDEYRLFGEVLEIIPRDGTNDCKTEE